MSQKNSGVADPDGIDAAVKKLLKFLEDNGETQKQFAKRADVPESAVSRLIVHGARVRWANAQKIETACNGRVKAKDIVS